MELQALVRLNEEMRKLKIVGIIPARYASTRFPGKPLVDICGRPMIWWVYRQLSLVSELSKVYVALDDERVAEVCRQYDIPFLLTRDDHATHLDRLAEFAERVSADFYININGDEPLMRPEYVRMLLPPDEVDPEQFYFANAMTLIKDPVEVVDTARIKIATDVDGNALYMARTPIPYPKASGTFQYKKFVGIQCASRPALLFCGQVPRAELEGIEDIDEYRLLEHGKKIRFIMTDAETRSVDTPKDLEHVRKVIGRQIETGEIAL